MSKNAFSAKRIGFTSDGRLCLCRQATSLLSSATLEFDRVTDRDNAAGSSAPWRLNFWYSRRSGVASSGVRSWADHRTVDGSPSNSTTGLPDDFEVGIHFALARTSRSLRSICRNDSGRLTFSVERARKLVDTLVRVGRNADRGRAEVLIPISAGLRILVLHNKEASSPAGPSAGETGLCRTNRTRASVAGSYR